MGLVDDTAVDSLECHLGHHREFRHEMRGAERRMQDLRMERVHAVVVDVEP